MWAPSNGKGAIYLRMRVVSTDEGGEVDSKTLFEFTQDDSVGPQAAPGIMA